MTTVLLASLLALTLASLGSSSASKPDGFLVEPKSGKGHGVLVLHPWWGLNADVKSYCQRLADAGFVAFAPDLFEGKTASTRDDAKALVQAFEAKDDVIRAKINDAAKYLAERADHKKLAVIGFSFGAYYALWFSNAAPDIVDKCVVYYGTGQEDFSTSRAIYLGHFAEKDEFEPKSAVESLTKLLHDAGRPSSINTYAGTGHWFAEPSVKEAYDKEVAELAWDRTLEFLRRK